MKTIDNKNVFVSISIGMKAIDINTTMLVFIISLSLSVSVSVSLYSTSQKFCLNSYILCVFNHKSLSILKC